MSESVFKRKKGDIMLNFVVCDDNIVVLNKLSKMLETIFIQHSFDANIVLQETCGKNVIDFVQSNHVDVLLLDINLKGDISGLNIAEEVRKTNKNAYIIFTTGHLEYVMMAYKFKTFDYLPKPITLERLEETILRLFGDLENMHHNKYIKIGNSQTIVSENDIQYIRRDGMKLVYHTERHDYEAYSSFNKIQDLLPNNFVRCHKSFIVNVNKITNIEASTNTISFGNDSHCLIGPKYKNNFMEVFDNYGIF